MNVPMTYARALAAIDAYLASAGATDVFINQLEDGYLIAFLSRDSSDGQQVVTLDSAEMQRLEVDPPRRPRRGIGGWFRQRDDQQRARARHLQGIGRYLDGRKAAAIVIQERSTGEGTSYTVEFTGIRDDWDNATGLTRLSETFDTTALQSL